MSGYAGKRSGANAVGHKAADLQVGTPGKRTLVEQVYGAGVQRRRRPTAPAEVASVRDAVAQGAATSSSPLPRGDTIQRVFARHDTSGAQGPTGAVDPQAQGGGQANTGREQHAAPTADRTGVGPTPADGAQRRPNATGLPDGLRSGIESLSGVSMRQALQRSELDASALQLHPNEQLGCDVLGSGDYTWPRAIQAKLTADPTQDPELAHRAAAYGTSGASSTLPHLGPIQRAFGRHDVSQIRAHSDDRAASGARTMGAEAYATGDQVAFAGAPSLHTAAHEAAHVVQQRRGVWLQGGVGRAGDPYERHADAVADAVVRGDSAEHLLDEMAPTSAAAAGVQRRIAYPIDGGEDHVANRRTELLGFLVEHFPCMDETFLDGRLEAMERVQTVYRSWEDVVEAITEPSPSRDPVEQSKDVKTAPSGLERLAAEDLMSEGIEPDVALAAATGALQHLIFDRGRPSPWRNEIVVVARAMAGLYTRLCSVLTHGVLSPVKLQEKGLAYTGSSDVGLTDQISAWDIDFDRNKDEHYGEPVRDVGHKSVSVALEREGDLEETGKRVIARALAGDVDARALLDDPWLDNVRGKIYDGSYLTQSKPSLVWLHTEIGRKARLDPQGGLTQEARQEMQERARNTAMVVSSGPPLDGVKTKMLGLGPRITELRTSTSEIPGGALTHVVLPEHMRWLQPVHTLAERFWVDVRFVGSTEAEVMYYDQKSGTKVNNVPLVIPDYQSALDQLWSEGRTKMVTHITRGG